MYDQIAKQRQVEAITRGNVSRYEKSPIKEKIPELIKPSPQSRDMAAAAVGTNGKYVDCGKNSTIDTSTKVTRHGGGCWDKW
jgi:hypothetical protein